MPKQNPKPDPKDLENTEVKRKFVQVVTSELTTKKGLKGKDEVGSNLVKCLETAVQETLGVVKKTKTNNELWKNDTLINSLLGQRKTLTRNSDDYKTIAKDFKARVNQLCNEKMAKEAIEINEYTFYFL